MPRRCGSCLSAARRNSLQEVKSNISQVPHVRRTITSPTKLMVAWWVGDVQLEVYPALSLWGGSGQHSKKTLCFGHWLCQKGFLLKDGEGLVWGWGGADESFGGFQEMWITTLERKKSAKVCWGTSLWSCQVPFSFLLHWGQKEGISSFIYSIPCHVDPEMASFPLPNCPVPFVAAHPSPFHN